MDYFLYLVSSSYVRVGVFEVDRVWIYLRIPLGVVCSLVKPWLGEKVYEREGVSCGCALISGPLCIVLLSTELFRPLVDGVPYFYIWSGPLRSNLARGAKMDVVQH